MGHAAGSSANHHDTVMTGAEVGRPGVRRHCAVRCRHEFAGVVTVGRGYLLRDRTLPGKENPFWPRHPHGQAPHAPPPATWRRCARCAPLHSGHGWPWLRSPSIRGRCPDTHRSRSQVSRSSWSPCSRHTRRGSRPRPAGSRRRWALAYLTQVTQMSNRTPGRPGTQRCSRSCSGRPRLCGPFVLGYGAGGTRSWFEQRSEPARRRLPDRPPQRAAPTLERRPRRRSGRVGRERRRPPGRGGASGGDARHRTAASRASSSRDDLHRFAKIGH